MQSDNDKIYQKKQETISAFQFDQKVADVFEDMISRSVPGYAQIISLLPTLSRQFAINEANYYDLGCSLGAGVAGLAQGLHDTSASIIGIDNSIAMLEKARAKFKSFDASQDVAISFEHADILNYQLENAAMVLMNFTLQFIALEHRDKVISDIFQALEPGGVLVLSEKLSFEDLPTNELYIDIHHQYKADQGYSQLEISQKRDAIENVLIPEGLETHIARLKSAGFKIATPWIQNLQFVSILGVK